MTALANIHVLARAVFRAARRRGGRGRAAPEVAKGYPETIVVGPPIGGR
jgi:hypothetical protein